jgi:hypothetical protein
MTVTVAHLSKKSPKLWRASLALEPFLLFLGGRYQPPPSNIRPIALLSWHSALRDSMSTQPRGAEQLLQPMAGPIRVELAENTADAGVEWQIATRDAIKE